MNFKKILFLISILPISVLCKEHKTVIGDQYFFKFGFRDHKLAYQEFKWSFNKFKIDHYINSFGLVEQDSKRITNSEKELRDANMQLENGVISFDYSKVIIDSQEFTKPLYIEFSKIVDKYELSKRDQLELIMRFLQGIPYKQPPINYKSRFIAGLFPPPEFLNQGWGDCDTKSILMASVLSHDPFFYNKLAVILVPGHALLGILAPPQTYDKTIQFAGKTYVYAEPVGPQRTPLGQTNSPYSRGQIVEHLWLTEPRLSGSQSNNLKRSVINSINITCPSGTFLTKYKRPFSDEAVHSCTLKLNGKYFKHGPTIVFDSKTKKLLKSEVYKNGKQLSFETY
ncbi:MAG: hypothetical protein HN576_12625 [Bacteriovoracaceae bacterium]|jgi:hypothetical protein|nr:hypothetical protein [Bacteriovoracaceae bacterium]